MSDIDSGPGAAMEKPTTGLKKKKQKVEANEAKTKLAQEEIESDDQLEDIDEDDEEYSIVADSSLRKDVKDDHESDDSGSG